MNTQWLKEYVLVILNERNWSWAVIGIIYVIIALIIRRIFLGTVIQKAKELNRSPYEEFKKAYLKRALLGWIFFFMPCLIVAGMWSYGCRLPVSIKEAAALLAAALSFLFSIYLHLQAVGVAAVVALKRVSEKEAGI